jgi:two-component system chemotaxis response regulator CheB
MPDQPPSSVVVVGASAGGVQALKTLAAGLPPDLSAPVAIVLHVSPRSESRLPQILSRAGPLPALHAEDGEPLYAGRIYIAPPDRHLLLEDGRCAVVRGPREHRTRPAIDPLFRSAATRFGRRVVGVISGARADGVAGASAISKVGGTVIVQDPTVAEFPDMPSNTIASDNPDRVLPLNAIAAAVADLVEGLSELPVVSDNGPEEMSAPSAFSCPACGGVLWEVDDDEILRFRRRVGHAYNGDSALDDQAEAVEAAFCAAFRALGERASLAHRLAVRHRQRGAPATSRRFGRIADEALEQAELIRSVLLEANGD